MQLHLLLCFLFTVSAVGRLISKVLDCYMPEDNGLSYRGLMDFAQSGRVCMKWTEQTEISTTSSNGIGYHRYCRNPDASFDTPWCFVQGPGLNDVRREQCSIDVCDDELRDFQSEADALKQYMGSHGCDCDTSLLSLAPVQVLRGAQNKFTARAQNSTALSNSHLLWVSKLVSQCKTKQGQLQSANSTNANLSLETQLRRQKRRKCGLTEVLANHCKCQRMHRNSSASEGTRGSLEHKQNLTGNVTAKSAVHLIVGGSSNSTMNSTVGSFQPTCSNACYSSACSSCTICTATCQRGPYAYCKSNGPADSQWWWAMCGVTTHDMLTKGKKQCGDAPPTGCPN